MSKKWPANIRNGYILSKDHNLAVLSWDPVATYKLNTLRSMHHIG